MQLLSSALGAKSSGVDDLRLGTGLLPVDIV